MQGVLMKEAKLQTESRLALGREPDIVVWRNHVAKAKTPDGRTHTFGLGQGSADLIGACRIEITEQHVGRVLAAMFAVELKGSGGRLRPEQKLWLAMVGSYGVRSGTAYTTEEAMAIAKGLKR